MIKANRKAFTYMGIVAWSFLTMLTIALVTGYGITGIDIILPCVFAFCLIVFIKAFTLLTSSTEMVKRELRFALPVGSIISVATVVGNKIDMDSREFGSFGIKDIGFILILIPFFASLLVLLFFSSDALSKTIDEKGVNNNASQITSKAWLVKVLKYMAIMLICWLPYYLTYYPGGLGNDIFECVDMCLGNIALTNHHPVIFTATLKLFIILFAGNGTGNLTIALGMMVLCQMITMALVIALGLVWIEYNYIRNKSKQLGKLSKTLMLVFVSLHPIFPMYSIYLTKDIIFACIIVLLVLFLLDFSSCIKKNEGKPENINGLYVILGLLCLGAMITRNNGTLVVIITAIAMLSSFRKIWKQLLLTFIVVFTINGVYKGPVWNTIGVEKQSFVESAAIPLTQIAYTIYTDGQIEGEDREYLERIMPFDKVKENFAPGYVDSYKFDEAFDASIVDVAPAELIKVWFRLLPDNFGRYVEAYLFETCGYWHYGISNTLCTEGVQPNELGIEGIDCIEKISGISLSGIIAHLMLVVRKLPILCFLSQMAVEMLAVICLGWQLVRTNRRHLLIAIVPLLGIWISVMIASPAYCLFRYMCPVFFLWPMIVYLFIINDDN